MELAGVKHDFYGSLSGPWFSPVKGRFRAPIRATCRTVVGRELHWASNGSGRSASLGDLPTSNDGSARRNQSFVPVRLWSPGRAVCAGDRPFRARPSPSATAAALLTLRRSRRRSAEGRRLPVISAAPITGQAVSTAKAPAPPRECRDTSLLHALLAAVQVRGEPILQPRREASELAFYRAVDRHGDGYRP